MQDTTANQTRAEADLYLAEKQVELIKAKAGLAQAEASYAKAAQDVERLKPLAAEAAVPAQELDAAVAAGGVVLAALAAGAGPANRVVRSPYRDRLRRGVARP